LRIDGRPLMEEEKYNFNLPDNKDNIVYYGDGYGKKTIRGASLVKLVEKITLPDEGMIKRLISK
jgi:hypothetical protein